MEIFRIIFISLSCGLLVLNLYFLIRRVMLTNTNKMSATNFVMISRATDNLIAFATEIIISVVIISLNIARTIDVVYNSVLLTILVLLTVCQIIICRNKFVINNDEITVTPLFGKTKKICFSNINTIKEFKSTKGVTFYTVFQGERELFAFSDRYIGSNLFMCKARKQGIKFSTVK